MKRIFESSRGSYGSRRMSRALQVPGHDVGRHKRQDSYRKMVWL
ncbi:hypothetical protein [Endozoicomonas sp.]